MKWGLAVPDLNWNLSEWGANYPWPAGGEEWSAGWGGSEAQWFGTIYPRIHRFLPAKRILEIAPGFGRWTKFLIPACEEFVGIDLSAKCIDNCRSRFADAKHARFITNDGYSLAAAQDRSFDFIYSFDSLVHVEFDVIASYVPEILNKLSPGGVAFIHHSNLRVYGNKLGIPDGRAPSVSAELVENLVTLNGGALLIQEIVNWGCEHLIDCLTLFARRESYPSAQPVRLTNPTFMGEMMLIKHFQSAYSGLSRDQATDAGPLAAA
jgi:SAM-dependent methyltransferase